METYVRTGDARAAYVSVGYADSRASMKNAKDLRIKLSPYVDEALGNYVTGTDMAILAVRQIALLSAEADSEAIRLAASKEMLSRGGWDTPQAVERPIESKVLTNAELDQQIAIVHERLKLVSNQ